VTVQGAHWPTNCTWLSTFHKYTTLLHNYAGSKEKSSKTTQIQPFKTKEKAKPCTENTRSLNLAANRLTTVRVTKLSLYTICSSRPGVTGNVVPIVDIIYIINSLMFRLVTTDTGQPATDTSSRQAGRPMTTEPIMVWQHIKMWSRVPRKCLISQLVQRWDTEWTIGVLGFDSRRGAGNFSLHHRVQNVSAAHPASYTMGTGGSFPGDKAAGAWNWPLTSI
jgi:hypothetical protein